MQSPEKQKVINCIDQLGRRVSVADVAAKTGLPLNIASMQLNAVAADCGGNLEVATTGDIVYKFAPGFQNAYLLTGIKKTIQDISQKAFQIAFYLLRISFGIMLILSLVIVVVLVVVAIMAMNKGSDNRDDGGFDFSFLDWIILRDLFSWGMYATYSTTPFNPSYNYSNTSSYDSTRYVDRDKGNFLLDCFSFLFGDGHPNRDIEEYRWQLVADTIRNSNGVVTVEQLAPYTGLDPHKEDNALPTLVRFNGHPEVTNTGNIVYTFPSLQVTAATYSDSKQPSFIKERLWQFSHVPTDTLVLVFILAAVNFSGSWWLWFHVHSIAALASLAVLINILVVYGTLFVAIPAGRFIAEQFLNKKIESSNAQRESYARNLQQPDETLNNKLIESKQYKIKQLQLQPNQIVYTTEKDDLEQEFEERIKKHH